MQIQQQLMQKCAVSLSHPSFPHPSLSHLQITPHPLQFPQFHPFLQTSLTSLNNFPQPPPLLQPLGPLPNITHHISFTQKGHQFLHVHADFHLSNSFQPNKPFKNLNHSALSANHPPHGPILSTWFPNLMAHGGHVVITAVLTTSRHLISIPYLTCKTFQLFSMAQRFSPNLI